MIALIDVKLKYVLMCIQKLFHQFQVCFYLNFKSGFTTCGNSLVLIILFVLKDLELTQKQSLNMF